MEKELFNKEHIFLNVECTDQKDAFNFIANKFVEKGYGNNVKKAYKSLLKREKEGSTGFNDGIAIPHAKDKSISKPGIFIFTFKNPLEWKSVDDSKVKIAIALAVPESKYGVDHIKILSSVARKLVDDDFRNQLVNANTNEAIAELINNIEII